MEIDLTDDHRIRRSRPWIEVTLISGFLFSMLVGIGALAVIFTTTRQETTAISTPALETLQPDAIVPQLALAQLAGDSAEALAYQAANAGEMDTTAAIVLNSTELSGPQRLSLLLRLGQDMLESERLDEALIHFNLARAVAVLTPSLDGIERIKALTQIASGLLAGGDEEAALDAAYQAMIAIDQTPGLLPAHRSQAYDDLINVANRLDDSQFTQTVTELARNPYVEPNGMLVEPRLASLPPYAGYDETVAAGVTSRMQAARLLSDRIILTGGVDIEPELQALSTALLQEEQIRSEYYRRRLSEGMSLQDQYALLLDQRNWQSIKRRSALKGYGLLLVPQWENDTEFIEQELGSTTANLHLIAEAMANERADPVDQTLLRTESLMWLAQQAELDLYPGASLSDLDNRLQVAQSNLARSGTPLALPVHYSDAGVPPGFRIVSTRQ